MIENKIFIRSLGGIGNRMKNLVSGMILAEKEKKQLLVEWSINDHLNCKFSDIFSYPEINFITDIPNERLSIPKDKDSDIIIDNCIINMSNIRHYKESIVNNFKKFIIRSDIFEKLIDFKSSHDKYFVGIHYRYDNEWIESKSNVEKMTKNNISFFDLFLNKINSYDLESTIFFVSCSNNIIMEKFKQLKINKFFNHKTQDCNLNKKNLRRDKIAMQEAILDLYTLAKCDEIIITPQSTFSECSWYLGGCKAKLYDPISKKYLIEL